MIATRGNYTVCVERIIKKGEKRERGEGGGEERKERKRGKRKEERKKERRIIQWFNICKGYLLGNI
jgi:hypothetical protein